MAKLTDTQLMILDNLIYLREIASGDDRFEKISDFIDYVTLDDGSIDEYKIREAERAAKISTLEAAGKYDEAEEIRQIAVENYSYVRLQLKTIQ